MSAENSQVNLIAMVDPAERNPVSVAVHNGHGNQVIEYIPAS